MERSIDAKFNTRTVHSVMMDTTLVLLSFSATSKVAIFKFSFILQNKV